MWTCERCGEQHERQFAECWKCFGKEIEHMVTATPPPPPAPPPVLRSNLSILMRMLIGACIGLVLGLAVFHRFDIGLEDAFKAGLITAGVVAGLVGLFFWVLFPYEPTPFAQISDPEEQEVPGT